MITYKRKYDSNSFVLFILDKFNKEQVSELIYYDKVFGVLRQYITFSLCPKYNNVLQQKLLTYFAILVIVKFLFLDLTIMEMEFQIYIYSLMCYAILLWLSIFITFWQKINEKHFCAFIAVKEGSEDHRLYTLRNSF